MISSNLGTISHRLAIIHQWQTHGETDGWTDDDNHANSL